MYFNISIQNDNNISYTYLQNFMHSLVLSYLGLAVAKAGSTDLRQTYSNDFLMFLAT